GGLSYSRRRRDLLLGRGRYEHALRIQNQVSLAQPGEKGASEIANRSAARAKLGERDSRIESTFHHGRVANRTLVPFASREMVGTKHRQGSPDIPRARPGCLGPRSIVRSHRGFQYVVGLSEKRVDGGEEQGLRTHEGPRMRAELRSGLNPGAGSRCRNPIRSERHHGARHQPAEDSRSNPHRNQVPFWISAGSGGLHDLLDVDPQRFLFIGEFATLRTILRVEVGGVSFEANPQPSEPSALNRPTCDRERLEASSASPRARPTYGALDAAECLLLPFISAPQHEQGLFCFRKSLAKIPELTDRGLIKIDCRSSPVGGQELCPFASTGRNARVSSSLGIRVPLGRPKDAPEFLGFHAFPEEVISIDLRIGHYTSAAPRPVTPPSPEKGNVSPWARGSSSAGVGGDDSAHAKRICFTDWCHSRIPAPTLALGYFSASAGGTSATEGLSPVQFVAQTFAPSSSGPTDPAIVAWQENAVLGSW